MQFPQNPPLDSDPKSQVLLPLIVLLCMTVGTYICSMIHLKVRKKMEDTHGLVNSTSVHICIYQ